MLPSKNKTILDDVGRRVSEQMLDESATTTRYYLAQFMVGRYLPFSFLVPCIVDDACLCY